MNPGIPMDRNYRLPPGRIVRRARDRYLYDQNSSRYLDAWLSDGAAFLGHRPDGYGRLVKEESDRGLWGAFPTQWPGRLRRALRELSALAGCNAGAFRIINGRFSPFQHAAAQRWLPVGSPPKEARIEIGSRTASSTAPVDVVLPAPGIIVPEEAELVELPAFSVALLTWAAHALVAYLESDGCRLREETAAGLPSPPGYRRDGVWFVPEVAVGPAVGPLNDEMEPVLVQQLQQWEKRRTLALTCGILVPPDPWTPLVVPDGMQSADRRSWERMCDEWAE